MGCLPLQPPEAVQISALVAFQFSVVAVPASTLLFMTAKVTAGLTAAGVLGVVLVAELGGAPVELVLPAAAPVA